MKDNLLLQWIMLPQKLRWLSLIGLLLGLTLIVYRCWIAPARIQQQQAQHELVQQRQRYQLIMTSLLQAPGLQALRLRNQRRLEEIARTGKPFSLYTLLRRSGGELEQWHPGQENLLQLWLDWPQLKRFFAYLAACEPAPILTAFTVQRRNERLHGTFHLAFDNEISLD